VRRALLGALVVVVALIAAAPASALPCDPIDPSRCLYPWPNDYFRDHGHLALAPSMMPANASGTPIEPADYNWSDGFSPGAAIVTKVPGLDTPAAFARTGSVPITDVARSLDAAAPILVINARTLRRQLIWTELDSNASTPANTALLIHPARNFREGERYIVALRNLRGADGAPLQPSAAFRRYRDRIDTNSLRFERRRPHMEHVFKRLKRAGVKRVVYASSSSVYGDRPELPKREDQPPAPISPYAVSKAAGEQYAAVWTRLYGVETVGLRYFNVFGPRQDPASEYAAVIPRFILFRSLGCSGCHAHASSIHAPDLNGVFNSQVHLSDGRTVIADEAYIRDSILDPRRDVVAGFQPIMPSFKGQLSESQLVRLIAYVKSLTSQPEARQ